jgi:hypothetical protein
MDLTEEAITRLRQTYPNLVVVARANGPASQPKKVLAVRVTVEGIRGGRSTARCAYDLIIDTSTMSSEIPPVWVAAPPDDEIKHVNIWRASHSYCRWTATDLPSICWHTYARAWSKAPVSWRTLGAALEYVKQLLNTENHESVTR